MRRGMSSLYTVVMLVALCGFVSLGVDMGHVQLAKTELRTAADAAARGAHGLATSMTQARADAVAVASANHCDGASVVLDSILDVEFGDWSPATKTFTIDNSTPTAVRVTARRIASRGTAIPLTFARVVGRGNLDVQAVAIATLQASAGGYGIVGINSVTMSGNGSTDSYNASAGPYYAGSAHSKGSVASNGNISLSGNADVNGDARPGPGKSVSRGGNASVSGSTSPLSSAMTFANATLPGSYISKGALSLSGNNSTTLTSGTYYYTSFSVSGNATVNISGQVTIYVSGPLSLSGNSSVFQNLPSNFEIYVIGANSVSVSGNGNLYASIYAPQSDISFSGNGDFFGSLVGKTLSLSGNGDIHYDESLGGGSSTMKISLVQ